MAKRKRRLGFCRNDDELRSNEAILTLYEDLQDFNDQGVQKLIMPRLTFAGSNDFIDYSEKWGNVRVEIASPLMNKRDELESLSWKVVVVDGGDHIKTMQPDVVLPIISSLTTVLPSYAKESNG